MSGNAIDQRIKSIWRIVVTGLCVGDRVLRVDSSRSTSIRQVAAVVVACGMLYGVAMGSYAMVAGERTVFEQLPQMLYSATKVPLLVAVTVLVSLPSFFVINSLFGLREDFGKVCRAIVAAQAGLAILLLSLAPLTLFVYVSLLPGGDGYRKAVLFNAMTFGFSSISAQMLLRRYYRPLVKSNRRHRIMVRVWILVYAFVGIQCGYIMRPFIGDPNLTPAWFRSDSFQNAYVRVFQMIVDAIRSF